MQTAAQIAATKFTIDYLMEAARLARPDCKPGIRIVAGKPCIYDADLLRSFECRELLRNAAAVDISVLSDAALDALSSAGQRRWSDTKHGDALAADVTGRVMAEQARRAAPVAYPMAAE